MLLSSRSRAYAHAIKDALAGGRAIAPQASMLGLTAEASIKTLSELHTLNVADGMATVGRKMIAESPYALSPEGESDIDSGCLGHLYSAHWPDDEGELPVVRTHGSSRVMVEPKLMLRFAEEPDLDSGLDAFIDAIDAIALAGELLLQPFEGSAWRFEDKICANGFGKAIYCGDLKTLSRSSKENFSLLLDHSTFSLNRKSAQGSALVDYTPGYKTRLSSIAALYQLLLQGLPSESKPIAKGDLVALNALCPAQPVTAGDEWICVSSGLELPSLRMRFSR